MMMLVYTYLFIVNVLAFFMYANDKHRAYYNKRRIPEMLLISLAVFGGAYGALCGMVLFKHKTLHKSFLITVPVSAIVWIALLVLLRLVQQNML